MPIVLLLAHGSLALNPVVPNVGMADPHVHVMQANGSSSIEFFMFSTHDYSPQNTGFKMLDWWLWSSPDLVTWTKERVLTPTQLSWDSDPTECWATDGAQRNGSTYFYVSAGPTQIGVFSSSSPRGPYSDPLGKPLVASGQVNTQSRDPCAFKDTDGEFYLVWGTFDYYVARLAPDMVSFAESPRPLKVINPTGPYGNKTDDKPFMHERNGIYYLSWGCFYATGSSPYGPFTYRGVIIDESLIAPDFRIGSSTSQPWYARDDFHDRHGSFWTHGGQWYWSANDRSHSTDTKDPGKYRDTVLTYLHFYNNGSMAPVVINGTGVSTHSLADTNGRVEAENFFLAEGGAAVRETSGTDLALVGPEQGAMARRGVSFHVAVPGAGARIVYPRVVPPKGGVTSVSLVVKGGRRGMVARLTMGVVAESETAEDLPVPAVEQALCDLGQAGSEQPSSGFMEVKCEWKRAQVAGGSPRVQPFRLEISFEGSYDLQDQGLGGSQADPVLVDRVQFD